jgi:large subunit ribosomal protein L24
MTLMIRKDDTVVVVCGKDAGKKGKVLKVFPKEGRAIVERINFAKKHMRRRREDQQSGIIEVESPVDISNLMLFCKQCNRQTRAKIITLKDGTKTRSCKRCSEVI